MFYAILRQTAGEKTTLVLVLGKKVFSSPKGLATLPVECSILTTPFRKGTKSQNYQQMREN